MERQQFRRSGLIRPATMADCEEVDRLENIIFPGYGEKFDLKFFDSIGYGVQNILKVFLSDGHVQGYLSILPLSHLSRQLVVSQGVTTIKHLPAESFNTSAAEAVGWYFEVIASAPWADRKTRNYLVWEAWRTFASNRHLEWYAHPITREGMRLATRLSFVRQGCGHGGLYVRAPDAPQGACE